jgi:hypothetical protein
MRLLLLSLLCLTSSSWGAYTDSIPTDGTVEVSITRWTKEAPPSGIVAVQVEVKSHLSQQASWSFTAKAGSVLSRLQLQAPAGGTARSTLHIHQPPLLVSDSYLPDIEISGTGPGISTAHRLRIDHVDTASSTSSGTSCRECIGVSVGSAKAYRSLIAKEFSDNSPAGLRRADLEMATAPDDWQALTGYGQLWLTSAEWQKLSTSQRSALLSWLALGGQLYLSAPDTAALDALIPGTGPRRPHGLGVAWVLLNDANFAALREARTFIQQQLSTVGLMAQASGLERSLGSLIPQIALPVGWIFLFILVFGLTVGPVNLFLLAPASRRPRLFWTTPLISLLGALVLAVIMWIKDGVGGSGARVVLATLLPEQKQLALLQHQLSQTGLLVGREFSFPEHEPVWALPHRQRPGDARDSYLNRRRDSGENYTIQGTEASGDWFRSRSEQTLLLQSLPMNRGELRVRWGSSPEVLSSLATGLSTVFVKDATGQAWKAERVATGQGSPLIKATADEFTKWFTGVALQRVGAVVEHRLRDQLAAKEPWFFALAEDPTKLAIPTLNSIRWQEDKAIITGPFLVEK